MHNYVRYDTPDHNGQTRRERNDRAGHFEPNSIIYVRPDLAYLWAWFWEISNARSDPQKRIPYSEIKSWSELNGIELMPIEARALVAMDIEFTKAFTNEVKDNTERQENMRKMLAELSGRR